MSLINTLTIGVTLKVVGPKGETSSVNIQPKGRVNLPAGWVISPNHVKEYQEYILGIPTPAPSKVQVRPVKA